MQLKNKLGIQLWQRISQIGKHLLLGCLVLLACTGCVQYRMELTFNWLSGGTIVQNLKWDTDISDFVGQFSDIAEDELFSEIEQRATKAGGTAQSLSDSEIRVEIPFDDYTQLEGKFNTFFDRPLQLLSHIRTLASPEAAMEPPAIAFQVKERSTAGALNLQNANYFKPFSAVLADRDKETALDKDRVTSRKDFPLSQSESFNPLYLSQSGGSNNFQIGKHSFFVADRYDLSYTLDLTDMKIPISGGFLTLSADRLLDLRIGLQTPIAASRSNATIRDGNHLEWHLNPGSLNSLAVSFWTPSPIGIALLVGIALAAFTCAWRLDQPERKG